MEGQRRVQVLRIVSGGVNGRRTPQHPARQLPAYPAAGHRLTPDACGYQKDGGVCNSTIFGYPFAPFEQMLADAPTKPNDYKKMTADIIPDTAATFKDNNWNRALSKSASALIFVSLLHLRIQRVWLALARAHTRSPQSSQALPSSSA